MNIHTFMEEYDDLSKDRTIEAWANIITEAVDMGEDGKEFIADLQNLVTQYSIHDYFGAEALEGRI